MTLARLSRSAIACFAIARCMFCGRSMSLIGHVKRHADFVCLGAANTYGNGGDRQYVGRDQLDASTLDRFWPVDMGYDPVFEARFVTDAILSWGNEVRAKIESLKLRRIMSSRKLIEASRLNAAGLPMDTIKAIYFASWTADERAKMGA